MSNPEQLLEMASALKARLTWIRRDIRWHPEVAFNEADRPLRRGDASRG